MSESSVQFEPIVTVFAWDDPVEGVYASWRDQARLAEHVHRALGRRLSVRSAAVGALTIVAAVCAAAIALAPVVAADAYATATRGIDPDVTPIVVASLAGIAAVLAAVQAMGRFAERAERHRDAALRYRSLDRAMAAVLALRRDARPSPDAALAWVRERLTRYERQSPRIPRRRRARLQASFRGGDLTVESASGALAARDPRSVPAT
jgi:hypothetical protein